VTDDDRDFAAFVGARGPALARSARLIAGSDPDADDLLQEALVKTLRRWRSLSDENLDAYVRTVMVRDHVRSWRRRAREVLRSRVPELEVEGAFGTVDDADAVLRLLAALPPRQRVAVVLRHYEGLSEAETARALGCSVGTVKSQTARGLAKLRVHFPTRDSMETGARTGAVVGEERR
jgi:RNA polymerase sigma-70 factor (sigma-E family)